MSSLSKVSLSECAKKNTFLGRLTGITPKSPGFPLRPFLENTKNLNQKKNNPPRLFLGIIGNNLGNLGNNWKVSTAYSHTPMVGHWCRKSLFYA